MYISLNDHDPKRKKKEFPHTMLYTACKDIHLEANGGVFRRESGKLKLVAFWCSRENKVKVGFGATDSERDQIWNFRITDRTPKES